MLRGCMGAVWTLGTTRRADGALCSDRVPGPFRRLARWPEPRRSPLAARKELMVRATISESMQMLTTRKKHRTYSTPASPAAACMPCNTLSHSSVVTTCTWRVERRGGGAAETRGRVGGAPDRRS